MKRDLLIGYLHNIPGSGLDNYIFHVLDALKDTGITVDVLCTHKDLKLEEKYPDVHFYELPRIRNFTKRKSAIRNLIRENEYKKVYFNISEAFDCIGQLAAADLPCEVLTHSHNSMAGGSNSRLLKLRTLVHKLAVPVLNKHTDRFLACSKTAADWMYGKDHPFELVRNTVNSSDFVFNPSDRKAIRDEYGIGDELVIGGVGALSFQKRPEAFIDILKKAKEIDPDAKVLLFGEGNLRTELEERIRKEHLEDSLILPGRRKDINRCYSAFDIFVMPSRFEGMPLAGIEAQINGLPVLFSKQIDDSSSIGPNTTFIDFDQIQKSDLEKALSQGRIPLSKLSGMYDLSQQKQQWIKLLA